MAQNTDIMHCSIKCIFKCIKGIKEPEDVICRLEFEKELNVLNGLQIFPSN